MTSSLYECHILHHRFSPRVNRFLYRVFFFAIDLDELDALHQRLRLFSVGQRNLYSFRDADFFPTHEAVHNATPAARPAPAADGQTLKARVVAFLAAHEVDLTGGKIVLVTLPRVLGYLFNPVSFYFCYDCRGQPIAAVAEVTNTFREVKPYFVGRPAADGRFRCRMPKEFYVSPFSDVDVSFAFMLRPLTDRLAVQIDDYIGDARTLTSVLTGAQHPLTDARLAWFTVKYPFITLRVVFLIHWHALQLWWKRLPWFAKAARADRQRDLYRPHRSLTPSRKL
ncbi:MAG: DUF1365 domain-containing protein [Candidatus Didemnitutus sp.]|nr:DUF1365 domain-containing protein [Candidatus Didemnitutus sp.]